MTLEARLEGILRRSQPLMHVLRTLRDLDLPDWMIFSGALYQRVFNDLTGRPLDYGIKDYDVAYYDASDLSYDAEDVVIRRVAAAFEPPLRDMVEVRNQARVHIWFEGHFGEPYEPLACSAQALERFVSPAHAVAVRLGGGDEMTIHAPFGLEDLFAMRLRRNPNRNSANFAKVAAGAKARWPEIEVLG
ncbi:nucleotidyltransferase family protein [uncultured Phenylobacterium sp.]|uniref:nucleotidyltransferase family protein n=1 Tax=uncultured Phenylobacterium sp. TaxID=349273 RepID=UPI0025FA55DE|nr:nucleotidyltransferase family protein [uncultured Phenylobacterium sp.]